MTIARLFTYWFSTVIIGSILAPLFISIGLGGTGGIFSIIPFCIIFSLIASAPAIFVFYAVLINLKDKDIPVKRKIRTLMLTHLGAGLGTFFIIGLILNSIVALPALIVFCVTYTGIGMLFWYFEFKFNREKTKDVTDELDVKSDESF